MIYFRTRVEADLIFTGLFTGQRARGLAATSMPGNPIVLVASSRLFVTTQALNSLSLPQAIRSGLSLPD